VKPTKRKTARDAGTSQGGKAKYPTTSISTDNEIVKMLEDLGAEQRALSGQKIQLCPRCGWHSLNIDMLRNPISLQADVHICRYCLQDEIGLRAAGYPPKPLGSWDYVRRMDDEN
jgi:hypothetical protein